MSTEEKRERMLSMVEDWKASGLTQNLKDLLIQQTKIHFVL